MKNLIPYVLTLLLFFAFVPSLKASPKGADANRLTVSLNLQLDNGEIVTLEGEGTKVTTPGSVFLKTYKFKLSEDSMEKIDFGYFANRIFGISLITEDNETLIGAGFLNKAGYLTVTIHRNGSGTFAPQGWLISFGLII